MLETLGKKREDLKLEHMGNFVFSSSLLIGKGEEGSVYLAQHIPTGQYAAVKVARKDTEHPAYQAMNRLFACYKDEGDNPFFYMFTPLVTALSVSDYKEKSHQEDFLKKQLGVELINGDEIHYKNWRRNVALMNAVIIEAEYCAGKDAYADPTNHGDMFIIDESEDGPQAVFVDLTFGDQYPLSGYHYLDLIPCFLGLKKFQMKDGRINWKFKVPQPITLFLEKYAGIVAKNQASRKRNSPSFKDLKLMLAEFEQNMTIWEKR